MTVWTLLWVAWIGTFFAIEIPAIVRTTRGGTLSETVWRWFHVYDHDWRGRLGRFLLLVLTAWLCVHFVGGGRLM